LTQGGDKAAAAVEEEKRTEQDRADLSLDKALLQDMIRRTFVQHACSALMRSDIIRIYQRDAAIIWDGETLPPAPGNQLR
jgi:hypothetical protein